VDSLEGEALQADNLPRYAAALCRLKLLDHGGELDGAL
jgi:hypothetical protein